MLFRVKSHFKTHMLLDIPPAAATTAAARQHLAKLLLPTKEYDFIRTKFIMTNLFTYAIVPVYGYYQKWIVIISIKDSLNEQVLLHNTCSPSDKRATAQQQHQQQPPAPRPNWGLTTTEYRSVWDKLRRNYVIGRTQGMLGISLDIEY